MAKNTGHRCPQPHTCEQPTETMPRMRSEPQPPPSKMAPSSSRRHCGKQAPPPKAGKDAGAAGGDLANLGPRGMGCPLQPPDQAEETGGKGGTGDPTADSGQQRKMAPLRQAQQPPPADQGPEPAASHPRAPSRRAGTGRGGRTHLATPHLKALPRPRPTGQPRRSPRTVYCPHTAPGTQRRHQPMVDMSTLPLRPRPPAAPGVCTEPRPATPCQALRRGGAPARANQRQRYAPWAPSPRPQALPIRPRLPWRRLGAKLASALFNLPRLRTQSLAFSINVYSLGSSLT
ncbi:synapsin-1-like [Physeter macrocephalus]|uniref:Synapsin-1-like n=1 Tax=Physeter macrocephalus TaxID=9755 RepID=A0A2Y9S2F4_PHYMC|nr:synapsin-1-like [Physeter catodon]|eukprot:XP_023972753.1 synapsin-1-like [Physeter catodon]